MECKFLHVGKSFSAKADSMNDDVQFFKNLLKDWKSENPDEKKI